MPTPAWNLKLAQTNRSRAVWEWGRHMAHGAILCVKQNVLKASVILPKLLSGISGGPRASDLITPDPSISEVFQLEDPAMGR